MSFMKGVFSVTGSLDSLKPLDLRQSLVLLVFPLSSRALKSLAEDFSEKTPFPEDPVFTRRESHILRSQSARSERAAHPFFAFYFESFGAEGRFHSVERRCSTALQ